MIEKIVIAFMIPSTIYLLLGAPTPQQSPSIIPFEVGPRDVVLARLDCQKQAETGHTFYIEIVRKDGSLLKIDVCQAVEQPRLIP